MSARIIGLTKAQHDAVEKLFVQDFPGEQLAGLNPKTAAKLVEKGIAEEIHVQLPRRPGQFAVTVKAWKLTLFGHFLYCDWCGSQPGEEP